MLATGLILGLFFWVHHQKEVQTLDTICFRSPANLSLEKVHSCRALISKEKNLNSRTENVEKFVEQYLDYDFTTNSQRQNWINFSQRSKSTDGNLFFSVELSNLRELNTILKDKNYVTSISNKYKEILESLGSQLVKKWGLEKNTLLYSDYKSYQGIYTDFSKKNISLPDFEKDKSRYFQAANKIFSEFLINQGHIKASDKPQEWFRCGLGFSADEANLSARVSRYLSGFNQIRIYSSPEVQGVLLDALKWQQNFRISLLKSLEGTDLFDQKTDSSLAIPQIEVFEILRKTEDLESIKNALIDAFGQQDPDKISVLKEKVTLPLIRDLKVYKDLVDTFSPSLMMAERNIASLEAADWGGMSADFMGLGALNIHAVAQALASSESVSDAIHNSRSSETRVTIQFQKQLASMNVIVKRYFPHTLHSGDDFVAFGNSPFSLADKKRLLQDLAEETSDSKKRISFIPEGVKKDKRNLIASHGENIEKELRIILKRKINSLKLSKIILGIDMLSPEAGSGSVQVLTGLPKSIRLSITERKIFFESIPLAIEKANFNSDPEQRTYYKNL